MNNDEKKIAGTLTAAFNALPDSKKEFLHGYAEGVAAMTEKKGQALAAQDRAVEGEG